MLVDNTVTIRNDGRLIKRWRMELQTYLVEAKTRHLIRKNVICEWNLVKNWLEWYVGL